MCVFYMHVWWYIFVLDFQICGGVFVLCVCIVVCECVHMCESWCMSGECSFV